MVVHKKVCAEVINHWELRITPLPTHAARTRRCVLMRKCVGGCSWRIQVGEHCLCMWQEQNSHMLFFFLVPLHSDVAKKNYSINFYFDCRLLNTSVIVQATPWRFAQSWTGSLHVERFKFG